jgi:glycosyltransferase involved in cell wall biosynthesis
MGSAVFDRDLALLPDLSICIPSYNRRELILALVTWLLEQEGRFEIRVHDDGSKDGTAEALSGLNDPRLHVTFSENAGRAAALAKAVGGASGRFTMLFDDDDELYPEGLARVLEDCARPLQTGIAGYIYHLTDEAGNRLGDMFTITRTNFLKLRNDFRIRGDKKEVVLTELLKPIVVETHNLGRRVPTSLYWATIALKYDVICRNLEIGRKYYQKGGMSDRIEHLKGVNPRPLVALYRVHAAGFLRGRYRSPMAAGRAMLALTYHSTNLFARQRLGRL